MTSHLHLEPTVEVGQVGRKERRTRPGIGMELVARAGCGGVGVLERARRYVSKCPPAVSGQHGHDATFRVACVLVHGFALSAGDALGVLRAWNLGCQPPWSESELAHKLTSALAASSGKPRGYLLEGRTGGYGAGVARPRVGSHGLATSVPVGSFRAKAVFAPAILRRVAALTPNVDEAFVKERSPICPETQTPASFLQQLFRPGEFVVVLDRVRTQGQIYEWSEPPYDAGCLNHLVNGCEKGAWFLCNPVDGKWHPNPRQGGKLSCRSEEAVVAWRYLLLESDEADPGQWLAALVQMPLRIASITRSAGRSIHALVRVDARSKAEWDAMARRLKPFMKTLGGDPAALKAVQLTRLAGCYRGQTGPRAPRRPPARRRWLDEALEFDAAGDPIWTPRAEADEAPANLWTGGQLQELLYLNPEPDTQVIVTRPTRQQIHAVWLAKFREEKAEVKP